MTSTIKLVVEAYYKNRKDVEVTVDSDGIIHTRIPDPAGDPRLCLGNTFSPPGNPGNVYTSLAQAIELVDAEVSYAPTLRADLKDMMATGRY